jgi:hypothetical protein
MNKETAPLNLPRLPKLASEPTKPSQMEHTVSQKSKHNPDQKVSCQLPTKHTKRAINDYLS